ncbi:type 1 glutamine amidotransferase [Companilactobacillus metriopterae]|uniref:type 1 glutamine amidotransferase n=1 Tax=Companilactobacillus metriopterae TaxID=1909267 RepID=UPI00100ABE65|nr:cobalamin biosynthesis protein CobQ [Companilactobacillus metriopterae]
MAETIKIAYLYEDLMNTYGDSGDVKILSFLLKEKGYDTQVDNISIDTDVFDAFDYDFLFFGGGQDFEQTVVAKDIMRHRETIKDYIEDERPMLGICGGYQFLGTYYETIGGDTIQCLNILPIHTVFKADSRMIGDTEFETPWGIARAFENHSGRTYFDDNEKVEAFGKMVQGYGNNPEDGNEGLRYKNTFGSYSHGPLLKNENIANMFVEKIIENHKTRVAE